MSVETMVAEPVTVSGRPSLVRLVAGEFRKISSTRLWWGLLLVGVLFTALSAGATAFFSGMNADAGAEAGFAGIDDPTLLRSIYGAGFGGTYVLAMVLGIVGMTGEYRYQTITPTFLVQPRRSVNVAAKMLAHVVMGVVYGGAGLVTAVGIGALIRGLQGHDLGLTAEGVPRTMVLSVLAVALWTLVGLGIGTLITNQVAAIIVGVVVAYVVEPLLIVGLTLAEADEVAQFLPSAASSAIIGSTSFGDAAQLEWWQGALVMVGYTAVFALAGLVTSVRRDIT